jgi:DNA-binding winged helix-turn-helix (wHTH) protein
MNRSAARFYEFGDYRLNVGQQLLTRGGRRVPLKPKVFALLLALVEGGGRVIEKEQLIRSVWDGYHVGAHNLDVTVHALRKILGETSGGRSYVETVPRLGYRLAAEVTETGGEPPARAGGGGVRRPEKYRAQNAEAREAHLKGRYLLAKRTPEGFRKSIEYFERAVRADPNYAPAHAALAEACKLLNSYHLSPPGELNLRAKAAATKALELDDTLAGAHVSLALVKYRHDWDWAGAEVEFRRAIELDADDATARHMYGMYLTAAGRFDEALSELRRALEIDPVSLIISSSLGTLFHFAGRYDDAVEQLNRTIELDADFVVAHYFLARTHERQGAFGKAVAKYRSLIGRAHDAPVLLAGLGYTYAVSGAEGEALKVLGGVEEMSKRRYVSPSLFGLLHAGLGEESLALAWLERACEERDEELGLLKIDPRLDPLRAHARFESLLRRVGLA